MQQEPILYGVIMDAFFEGIAALMPYFVFVFVWIFMSVAAGKLLFLFFRCLGFSKAKARKLKDGATAISNVADACD